MASISKLSIRGVRAFSPEDIEQCVEFYFPCTIIVGQNGCGKTTIIEALKFAITGSLPPGNKSGQAFVHDPRSIGQSTVKANVKLRFTSRKGQAMVVVRSMELSAKKKSISFKQLDGVLRMFDGGQKVALSHKCTELDKQIPSLLGISKAILDNVLFCHQEDASWPLQEGAVLKKRFDDIFDSTRYTKALEVFHKTEKELINKVKDIKAELMSFQSHKLAADGFNKELQEQYDLEQDLQAQKEEILQEVAEVNKDIAQWSALLEQIQEAQSEVDMLRSKSWQEQAAFNKQLEMVEEDLTKTHTLQQLQDMLTTFDERVSGQKEEEARLERQVEMLHERIDDLHKNEMELKAHMGKHQAEKDAHEKRLKERYTLMESVAQTYAVDLQVSQTQQTNTSFAASLASVSQTVDGLSQDTLNIASEDLRAFFRAFEKKESELIEKRDGYREQVQAEEDRMQKLLSELGGQLSAANNEKGRIVNQLQEIMAEQNALKDPTSHRLTQREVDEAKANADHWIKARKDAESNPRKVEIPAEIRMLEDKIEDIKRKLEDDRLLLESLRETSDEQNAIAILEDQRMKDIESLEESIRSHSSSLQRFNVPHVTSLPKGDDDDADNLIATIEEIEQKVKDQFSSLDLDLNKIQHETMQTQKLLSEKTALRNNAVRSLSALKSQLEHLGRDDGPVARLRSVCSEISDFENGRNVPAEDRICFDEKRPTETLADLNEVLAGLQADNSSKSAVIKMYKRIIRLSKLEDGTRRCPCCARDMNNEELSTFSTIAREMLSDNSELLKEDKTNIEIGVATTRFQKWRDTLIDCIDDAREFWRLSGEIEQVEIELQALDNDVAVKQDQLKERKLELDDLKHELSESRDLLDAAKRWTEDAGRIADKKIQIRQKRLDLNIHFPGTSRDLRTVERDVLRLSDEKESMTMKINLLNKEMTKLNSAITHCSNEASNAERRAQALAAKFETTQKSVARKRELNLLRDKLKEDERRLSEEISKLNKRIHEKEREKARFRKDANDQTQSLANLVNDFDSDFKRIRDLTRQIDEYYGLQKTGEFDGIEAKLSKIAEDIEERKAQLKAVQPKLESVRSVVKDQERQKNQLKYNIDIFERRCVLEELDRDIRRKEVALHEIEGYDTCNDRLEAAETRKAKLIERKAQTEGRYSEVVDRIRSVKRKLSAPEYKNVAKQLRIAKIEHETTLIAAEDLKKYQKALDNALLQYHSVKIGEVNKIIREVWLLTYKGEDISNIEIVSGQEADSRAQKSYNYRVVMTKGSTELDMRGRCSAGQRVLASIVIRLALAETFGVNCGCIALDEPTVNLDYRNKQGLAVALAQIIASRSHQRNFQMILITHDEEFVDMMKTEMSSLTGFSMPEKYFQVCREQGPDGKYYSKIHALDWD